MRLALPPSPQPHGTHHTKVFFTLLGPCEPSQHMTLLPNPFGTSWAHPSSPSPSLSVPVLAPHLPLYMWVPPRASSTLLAPGGLFGLGLKSRASALTLLLSLWLTFLAVCWTVLPGCLSVPQRVPLYQKWIFESPPHTQNLSKQKGHHDLPVSVNGATIFLTF